MRFERYSAAIDAAVNDAVVTHLARQDGQEDLCLAIYAPSSGNSRFSGLIREPVLPQKAERIVHGNVEFSGEYVLRAATLAASERAGIAILHSHPFGRQWQGLSTPDFDAESSYAILAQEVTGLPLLGMTYAGQDGAWSARFWDTTVNSPTPMHCESVRVVGDALKITWNDNIVPVPKSPLTLSRTMSCWGPSTQADFSRMRILVVGAGTIGLDVAIRLVAAGVRHLGLLDFDLVELWNLDRLFDATIWDVLLGRSKLEHADRVLRRNATADRLELELIEASICDPAAFAKVLDYDLVVCAIDDRPWPRSILNAIPYTDLIPVVDGGVHVDLHADDKTMRNATWRAHVLRPGRPCMACNGQLELGAIQADKQNLWEDPAYIAGLPRADLPQNQNVGMFAAGASAGLLSQIISFVANPSGLGDPGPVRFNLSTHWLERIEIKSATNCVVESQRLVGDDRRLPLDTDGRAKKEITKQRLRSRRPIVRALRQIERLSDRMKSATQSWLFRHLEWTLTDPETTVIGRGRSTMREAIGQRK